MRHPNLFSLSEDVIDRATNGKFTIASLLYDKRHEDQGPKSNIDRIARDFIKNGEIPESYRQKMNRSQNNSNEEEENIKEEAKMPFFKLNEECACGKDNCNCGQGVSTGIAKADGLLHKIPVNQFQKSDSNFVGDGEDPETSKVNVPSILAAKAAGGDPDPKTVHNGINKHDSNADVFKVKPVADEG